MYKRTRTIITDAASPGNFIINQNAAIPVDFDLAFRSGSPATDKNIKNEKISLFNQNFWNDYTKRNIKPRTTATLRTLVYLDENMQADEIKDEYITPQIIERLHSFRVKNETLSTAIMERLVLEQNNRASSVTTENIGAPVSASCNLC